MLKKSIIVTVLTIVAATLLSLFPLRLAAIFPEQFASTEVKLSDILFHLNDQSRINNHIILINCGRSSRREIARLLDTVSAYQPKVIGMDMLFNCPDGKNDTSSCPYIKDSIGVKNLSASIRMAKNIVLVNKLRQTKKLAEIGSFDIDSIEFSDGIYSDHATNGFANIISDNNDGIPATREFEPHHSLDGKNYFAFAVEVAKAYDPIITTKFLNRQKEIEVINYASNIYYPSKGMHGSFTAYEMADVIDNAFDKGQLENKIILFGYLGDKIGEYHFLEDAFFSPLNPRPFGRSYPDMYGLVIHANIIQQILSGSNVEALNLTEELLITFAIIFCTVLMLTWTKTKNEKWFFLLAILIILGVMLFEAMLRVWLFFIFNTLTNFGLIFISLLIAPIVLKIYDNLVRDSG